MYIDNLEMIAVPATSFQHLPFPASRPRPRMVPKNQRSIMPLSTTYRTKSKLLSKLVKSLSLIYHYFSSTLPLESLTSCSFDMHCFYFYISALLKVFCPKPSSNGPSPLKPSPLSTPYFQTGSYHLFLCVLLSLFSLT